MNGNDVMAGAKRQVERHTGAPKPSLGRVVIVQWRDGDDKPAIISGLNEDGTVDLSVLTNDTRVPVAVVKSVGHRDAPDAARMMMTWAFPERV